MIGVSVIALIILLGVLIFVHEFGHFWVAKKMGVGVLKFSLGFGPKLVGRKIGETEYVLSLVPLGGYVKLLGEAPDEEIEGDHQKRSFSAQNVYRRFAIVAAGPLFNLLLAILVFFLVNMVGLEYLTSRIGVVTENSPAALSGIKQNDLVTAVNGANVARWDELAKKISGSQGRELALTVRAEADERTIKVLPQAEKGQNIFGEEITVYRIGIRPANETAVIRLNPLEAAIRAFEQTGNIVKLTVLSIVKMIQGILSPTNLGGPVLIAQMAGVQAREGLIPFLLFMALLSVNLAILNLLPIPVLDGGHLVFFLVEMIRGREVSVVWRERAQQVGLMIIVTLMVFVLFLDFQRLNLFD